MVRVYFLAVLEEAAMEGVVAMEEGMRAKLWNVKKS